MGKNHVRRIRIGSGAGGYDIDLVLPTEGRSAITALCGRNNTGKSYVIRGVNAAIRKGRRTSSSTKTEQNVHIEYTNPDVQAPKALYVDDIPRYKERLVQISARGKKQAPLHGKPPVKEIALTFVADCLAAVRSEFDREKWMADEAYRIETTESFERDQLHSVSGKLLHLSAFERATGGRLYFMVTQAKGDPMFQPALVYGEKAAFKGQDWSAGQKSLFAAMMSIHVCEPDVLLLDEIENHLHPEYMTVLLEYVADHVDQAVLVSHHPHVLFSSLVDRVYYFEGGYQRGETAEQMQFEHGLMMPSPQRTIHEMENGILKMTAAYDLFHARDRQLLALSEIMYEVSSRALSDAVLSVFANEVKAPNPSRFADTQTQQLIAEIERATGTRSDCRVLDVGAGRGRSYRETIKKISLSGRVASWTFFEPDRLHSEELKELCDASTSCQLELLESLSDLDHREFDVVIIANVLHELVPEEAAELLVCASQALRVGGILVIQELYPLVRPEKFAVAYTGDDFARILPRIGWKYRPVIDPVRRGKITATTLVLHSPDGDKSVSESVVVAALRALWDEKALRCANEYDGLTGVATAEDYITLMSSLTTIASITAYNKGVWAGWSNDRGVAVP